MRTFSINGDMCLEQNSITNIGKYAFTNNIEARMREWFEIARYDCVDVYIEEYTNAIKIGGEYLFNESDLAKMNMYLMSMIEISVPNAQLHINGRMEFVMKEIGWRVRK